MRNFMDLKILGTYTSVIINSGFPLLNKDHTEFLGCWNESCNSNIQCVWALCICLGLRVKTSGDENEEQHTLENVINMYKSLKWILQKSFAQIWDSIGLCVSRRFVYNAIKYAYPVARSPSLKEWCYLRILFFSFSQVITGFC